MSCSVQNKNTLIIDGEVIPKYFGSVIPSYKLENNLIETNKPISLRHGGAFHMKLHNRALANHLGVWSSSAMTDSTYAPMTNQQAILASLEYEESSFASCKFQTYIFNSKHLDDQGYMFEKHLKYAYKLFNQCKNVLPPEIYSLALKHGIVNYSSPSDQQLAIPSSSSSSNTTSVVSM